MVDDGFELQESIRYLLTNIRRISVECCNYQDVGLHTSNCLLHYISHLNRSRALADTVRKIKSRYCSLYLNTCLIIYHILKTSKIGTF